MGINRRLTGVFLFYYILGLALDIRKKLVNVHARLRMPDRSMRYALACENTREEWNS